MITRSLMGMSAVMGLATIAAGQSCTGWTLAAGGNPPEREGAAMVFDVARARCLLFGGRNESGALDEPTWVWDGFNWWSLEGFSPPARSGHAMAYDQFRDRTVLFGGINGASLDPVTWEYDGVGWSPRDAIGPSPRHGHAMVYDSTRSRVVIFGGLARDAKGNLGLSRETWTWDGDDWTLASSTGPSARSGHAMGEIGNAGLIALYGGTGGAGTLSDTWLWDGAAWQEVIAPGPGARAGHAMAWDDARGRLQLTGGAGPQGPALDGWEFDGQRWIARGPLAFGPRQGHVMAYDARRARMVLHGGRQLGTLSSETWETGGAPFVAISELLAPIGGGAPQSFQFQNAPLARGRVLLEVWARADLGSAVEALDLSVNGSFVGRVFSDGGSDCPAEPDHEMIEVALAQYNSLVAAAGGQMSVTVTPTAQVDGSLCGGDGYAVVRLSYAPMVAGDCNRNGLPDGCDIASGLSADTNGDEIPDECAGACIAPAIAQHPSGGAARPGQSLSLAVQATGSGPRSYQWFRNGFQVGGPRYAVGTDGTLTISPVAFPGSDPAFTDAGQYTVLVSNNCGSVMSHAAVVQVDVCSADFNRDGAVSSQDFFDFITAFFVGCP